MTLFFRIFLIVLKRKKNKIEFLEVNLQTRLQIGLRYCYSKLLLCFWLLFDLLNPVFDDTGLLDLFKAHEMQIKFENYFPLGQLKLIKVIV